MVNVLSYILAVAIMASPFVLVLGLVLVARWRRSHQADRAAQAVAEAQRRADIQYWLNLRNSAHEGKLARLVLEALGFPAASLIVSVPSDPYERQRAVRNELWAWEDPTHPVALHRLAQLDPHGHLRIQVKIQDSIHRKGFAVQW
jgi:hypothetical protein